jgi:hypothetical protein
MNATSSFAAGAATAMNPGVLGPTSHDQVECALMIAK